MKPNLSCIFLTRKCYMRCGYCSIRQSKLESPELTPEQWVTVFRVLEDLGVVFNLILGNEPLTLGEGLIDIIKNMPDTDYALYTSAPPHLFNGLKQGLLDAGLRNLSCGYDFPLSVASTTKSDQARKSSNAYYALRWAKHSGILDYQGTTTINATNLRYLTTIIKELDSLGIWVGYNFIHWAKDAGYDFFPPKSCLDDYIINPSKAEGVFDDVNQLIEEGAMIQLPTEYLDGYFKYGHDLSWHCSEPILSIDPNGRMRTCGYRRGVRTRLYSIFDLTNESKYKLFLNDWLHDMRECPGCYWSYPWLNEYWLEHDSSHGEEVFKKHASKTAEVK